VLVSHILAVDSLVWGIFVGFATLTFFSPLISTTRGMGLCAFSANFNYDLRGAVLVVLTLINLWSCFLAQTTIKIARQQGLQTLLLALAFTTIMFFVEGSWLKFYIYFEASLIPIFLIIMGWGYQIERVKASKAIVLYTVVASLPLLLVLLVVSSRGGDISFQVVRSVILEKRIGFISLFLTLAFLVKLPLLYCHIWLPKAHVEAPVVGSMFLAAVLLKLGGFGLIKVSSILDSRLSFSTFILSVARWSIILIRGLCVQATDIKVLIAFSSVSHMAVIVIALTSSSLVGANCALLVLLSHGIRSSAAFFFRFIFYKAAGTRNILLNKGSSQALGIIALLWVLCCLGVIGAPPTFNLWVEVNSFISVISRRFYIRKPLFWGALLTGVYRILLVSVPISFNTQFKYTSKNRVSQIDLVHLMHSGVLLILLAFFSPIILI